MHTTQAAPTGSFVYPAAVGKVRPSTTAEMDAALQVLRRRKDDWARQPIPARVDYLEAQLGHDDHALGGVSRAGHVRHSVGE